MSQFRKDKGFSQEQFGKKLGLSQATYQTYESGRTSIPSDIQSKIRKLGFEDSFPVGKKPDLEGGSITREEFAEYRGTVKAEISMLKDGLEKAFELIRDLALRLPEESRPKAR